MKTPPFPIVLLSLIVFAPSAFPGEPAIPQREISMRECVEIALRNNIDIAVSRAERNIEALGVPIEEAAFLPKFSGDLNTSRSLTPSSSALNGTLSVDQRILSFNVGIKDLLPTGTALSLSFENQRQETDSAVSLLTPAYITSLSLSAQQPLLKNRGRQVTEAPLRIARAGAAAKTEEWKAKAMDIVASARVAFLSFFTATREAEVRKTAVELAERLMAQTDARIDAGGAAPMDRLPAEAAVASRREELLRADAAAQSAADDLKNVLGVRSSQDWDERLVPILSEARVPPPGPDETMDEAFRRRPEVTAQGARRLQAEIQETVARNHVLPSLDLTASGGLSGLSGAPNPNPLFPVPSTAFAGNYRDSLDRMVSGRYFNWFLGLKTELPWRFDREKAEWARARTALEEQRLLEEALSLRIRSEVRKGRRDLFSALERIEASRSSAAASSKKLEAEEKKLALGRSTSAEVLRFQQDISEARLAEVRAQADAYLAQTRLWRAVGVILEKEGIVLK